MNWSFYKLWNDSFENNEGRELKERDYIWASEIGQAFIDRYLKMTAVPPTNPPNARSRRKFEAGNIWESIVAYVLSRASILQERQDYCEYQYPNLLRVTGKLDLTAGGKPDYEKAQHIIAREFAFLPAFISKAVSAIVQGLQEQHPDGLDNIVLEIKSCSAYMFDIYENRNQASRHHKYQLFHYLKSLDWPEGHIVYVCRDDARLFEVGVFNPSIIEDDYKNDIELMTRYYNDTGDIPKEKFIVFDHELAKFSANWKVAYSQYLTYLYGFKNQLEFDEQYKPVTERWNRVLGRINAGKEMTKNNLAAIDEMAKEGFDIEDIKPCLSNKTEQS